MALTDHTETTDVALNTDLYELTMAQGFWESGLVDTQACFNAFFRENPFEGGYAVSCGQGQIADLIDNFVFTDQTIDYLASIPAPAGGALFKHDFLEYLRNFHMHVSIWAPPEGELLFPREPMVRVEGPIIDCQLLETALLNLMNFQTLVATKTARVVTAAQGHAISDFGLRRAQGPDGGLAVARASYIGGASSTSNVLAGKIYGIPVFGTHAHSWVMAFPTELDAFRAFARSMPKNCVLLLDTYDVHQGIKNAITVAKEMEASGEHLAAIRIDSGDLAKLTKEARTAFDQAGLSYVKISASNDLDEYTIQSLFAQGAPIDSFGVGTKLATCDPQPSLGGSTSFPPYRMRLGNLGVRLSSCLRCPTSAQSLAFNIFAATMMQVAYRWATRLSMTLSTKAAQMPSMRWTPWFRMIFPLRNQRSCLNRSFVMVCAQRNLTP